MAECPSSSVKSNNLATRTDIPTQDDGDLPDFPIEEVEEAAAALELVLAYPQDYLQVVRSTCSRELLQAAAQLLPEASRAELMKLVKDSNREVA